MERRLEQLQQLVKVKDAKIDALQFDSTSKVENSEVVQKCIRLEADMASLRNEHLQKEVDMQRQLTEALTVVQNRTKEIQEIQKQFERYKKESDQELSTTLEHADKTITDLERRLNSKRKLIKKSDAELRRLRDMIEKKEFENVARKI